MFNRRIDVVIWILLTFFSASQIQSEVQRREEGNLVIENIPQIPQRIAERMQQYQNIRAAFINDWDTASEGILISTRFGETEQIHYVEKPGAARQQKTFFSEPVSNATICPDATRHGFLFNMDALGSEAHQIFYFDLDIARYAMLTDGSSRYGEPLWSNKGDWFTYFSTKRNGRDQDIYIRHIDHPDSEKRILAEGGLWWVFDWSPDDKHLLVSRLVSITETYYYTVEIATGQLTEINPNRKVAYGPNARWSRDERGIFITSNQDSEFFQLRYYDLETKTLTNLTADIPWDVQHIALSAQGNRLAFGTNEGGIIKLYLLDTQTMKYEPVENLPLGIIYGLKFHPSGNRLAFVTNTPQTPGDVHVLSLIDGLIVRWTYSEVGGLNTDAFSTPQLIHYQTFDTVGGKPRLIPAFYYKPTEGEAPCPVLIQIHGGPDDQQKAHFSPAQYWVNELGIAVLQPNVRGSSGYGKTYLKLDDGHLREDAVKDIGKLLDWIEKQPELDASRVAVIGGSYGGYMVLASMTHYNDRLRCGVDMVGTSNFVTLLENTAEYRRDWRRAEYGDERDLKMREFLIRISPITNAHKITKPMYVIHGKNDPRVPVGESEQIVSAIRKNGGMVWYLLASLPYTF